MQITFDPTNSDECGVVATMLEAINGVNKPVAAKAAAPAKKAAAAKAAPAPEPEADEDEDLLGGGEPEVAMEDAVAKATELVSQGKAAEVKAALAKVGAKRVSEVTEANLAKFVKSLG